MTVFKVGDMKCGHCAARISKALDAAGVKYEVDLENKTVSVDGCSHCAASAKKAIEEAGYTPTEA
ncbi:MAG: heavy-metal-associated domain-containing protein [Oscillospiraceae bacterium]|jgi:copper chaperone CopZ|nr:heavy-metal-associated domain-containing protein [Oscillospiraceae bacterium]MCR5173916.1 heavy-metal-associated domain-containing protein [Oscillospiraceae bacterium]